jgi:class 3 adenylate cyclase
MLPGPPDRVWPLVANNDLLNREMGLPLPTFSFAPREEGGTRVKGEISVGPLRLRYEEHPFDWQIPYRYSVRRVFERGPIRTVIGTVQLDAVEAGTNVTTLVEVEAKAGGGLPARAFAHDAIRRFERVCRGFADYLGTNSATPFPREASRPSVDEGRLRASAERLKSQQVSGGAVDALAKYLREVPAAETVLFRPTRLAKWLRLDRREALELCLAATDAGMLDLSWRVMCPYCGGNRQTFDRLNDLSSEAHCESCAIRFDSEFDTNVEVLFSVAHAIRPVVRAAYCIGGPHLAPNVVAQVLLEPLEKRRLHRPLAPGTYRVRSRQASASLDFQADSGAAISVDSRGFVVRDAAEWTIKNALDTDVVVRIEKADAPVEVVTAAEVTTMAAFRDRFSAEVLSPGAELAVRQVCLLFTDLKESTRMYRERGDAPSYAAVRRHFERLEEAVVANGGVIVKTIGDAVMAAFHDPADGVRAALAIQEAERELVTKIGIHSGPAIVVNANGILDYFGRTVNLAARLQKHSVGGDFVATRELADDPRVAVLLAGLRTETFCEEVRGVAEEVAMIRVWPKGLDYRA